MLIVFMQTFKKKKTLKLLVLLHLFRTHSLTYSRNSWRRKIEDRGVGRGVKNDPKKLDITYGWPLHLFFIISYSGTLSLWTFFFSFCWVHVADFKHKNDRLKNCLYAANPMFWVWQQWFGRKTYQRSGLLWPNLGLVVKVSWS